MSTMYGLGVREVVKNIKISRGRMYKIDDQFFRHGNVPPKNKTKKHHDWAIKL